MIPFDNRDGWIWPRRRFRAVATPASTSARTHCIMAPACSKANACMAAASFELRRLHAASVSPPAKTLDFEIPSQ